MNVNAKSTLILASVLFGLYGCNDGSTIESKHSLELVAMLSNPDGETRAAAAAELRQLIAANPDARTNDHGEEYWRRHFAAVYAGTKYSDFKKLLPDSVRDLSTLHSGQSGVGIWRLDHYWTVTLSYQDPDRVYQRPKLKNEAMRIWVSPPADFTGTWVTWYVNGQKSYEIDYKMGKYNGTFTAFYDNGRKRYQQHYKDGKGSGSDTGWYPDGSKMYQGAYTNGKQTGTWTHWNKDGSVRTVERKN